MITIRSLDTKDIPKAMQFAIKGMHFDKYTDNALFLNLYARYFLYTELERATHILAAYEGDELMGLLLAEVKGAPKAMHSFWRKAYVSITNLAIKTFFSDGAGRYEEINQVMHAKYMQKHQPDGEIIFLAANPDKPVKGLGTMLLQAFEKTVKGKEIFLYTDDNCTYQFYEKRGFERAEEENIMVDSGGKQTPLSCFLYRKQVA